MTDRYDIEMDAHFNAAHHLCGHAGPCANPHGHTWRVSVVVTCSHLDAMGMGIDFAALKSALDHVIAPLDHQDLNQVPPFDRINPTAEHLARYIYRSMTDRLADAGVRVARVRVEESPGAAVVYREVHS